MARPHQPGLHDPYWYEATFAERFIVEMLNADSGILSVTIQAPGVHGIDDVVVKYRAKADAYHQLKHTRAGETLSFADLTSVRGTDSLLGSLAKGWAGVTRNGGSCETHLWTNREMAASPRGSSSVDNARPSLEVFWCWLSEAMRGVDSLDAITVPNAWKTAWDTWTGALHDLAEDEKLAFLRSLHLDAGQAGLAATESEVRSSLATIFGVPEGTAERALERLDHHLRIWATSERGADAEITPERALRALSIDEAETVGDHSFAPPSPFFPSRASFADDLATTLRQSDASVFFLTGPAGCGKSSVVSALANRAQPVVDLRFHAFRPLTPYAASIPEDAGRAVTAVALWGDLLVQLRTFFFAGRLWEHQVPVRNDFLSNDPTRLREHVLRLGAVLSKERGRPTIIAIDGLDHAARARHLTPEALAGRASLLASLIPPDEVPRGVLFLIAGQPGWEGYPSWLRTPREDVRVIDVPPIDADDIATLLRAAQGSFPADQVDAAARVIADLTKGNTLPVVYAVAEAQTVSGVAELQARLSDRRLGGSLDEYYSAIWSTAVGTHVPPATRVQLATALALSTARLTPDLLTGFFPESSLSSADWRVILRKLAPIVDATADTFAIRHNDLRVFLMAYLQADRPSLMAATSAMASFYRTAPPSDAKHADLLRLLDLADRKGEIPAVVSPTYIADAIALHRPMSELVEQGALALASVTNETGWKGVHTLALGLATLQQARSLVEYYSLEQAPRTIPPCLVSEARVLPRSDWSLQVIERLFADAKMLLVAGEHDRAQALMCRWLRDLTPVSVAAILKAQPGDLQPWEARDIDERIANVIRTAGELAQSVGVNRATLREPSTEASRPVLASFYGGWLIAGVHSTARPWVRTLQMPRIWYFSDVEKCVTELASGGRWSDVVASLEVRGDDRERMSLFFRVRAAQWAIRAHATEPVLATWAAPVVTGGFAALTADEGYPPDLLDLYTAVAFVMGYLDPGRHSGGITDEGATAYFRRYSDLRREEHVRRLLYAAAWTGNLLRRVHTRAPEEPLLTPGSELAAVVRSLLFPAWDKPAFVPPEFLSEGPRLVALILESLRPSDVELEPELSDVLVAFASERRASSALEVVWPALAARGRRDLLEAWMRDWIGEDGRVWGLELGERFGIVRRFSVLARSAGWDADAQRAEDRLRWNQLGYTGHKDYSLIVPLNWFRAVATDDPAIWETFGARLLSISDEASRTGDNRMGVHVDGAVATAAARCGPSALWRLASASAAAHDEPFVFGEMFVFDGIIGALETAMLPADDLRAIWSAGIGGLVWEHERGRMETSHLREALAAAANRIGHASVPAALEEMAPFEFAMEGSSRLYKHPTRWFESPDAGDGARPASELEREIAPLAIDDAVRRLTHAVRSASPHHLSDVWRAVETCGKRLQSEHPPNHANTVKALVDILRLGTEQYSWSFDSFGDAVASIVPLLPEADQWAFCRAHIAQIDTTDAPDVWLSAASENLRNLARLHALTTSEQDRVAGLDDELRMHEIWILGSAGENRRAWPSVSVAAATPADPQTWAAFALWGLVDVLRSAGSARCRAAIKGLYALLADHRGVNDLGAAEWPRFSTDQRERLLLLFERLAGERPGHFAAWQRSVEHVLETGAGAGQLQAWVTLQAFARATGASPERWPLPVAPAHKHGTIVRAADPLLDLPRDTMGTVGLTYGVSGLRQLAQMFAHAINEDEDLIEVMVSEHVKTNPPSLESSSAVEPTEDLIDGEMKMFHGEGVRETIQYLVEEARAGCFGDVPPSALAQALLTNDEPRLLTTSGRRMRDVLWPVDDALETLISSGEAAVVEALRTVARAGVLPGERVIAAELETYSRRHDVALHLATGWARDPLAPEASRRPSTFNGRAHLLYGGGGYEPRQSQATGWLTFRAGGLGMFVHSSLSLVPASIWRRFGWEPTPTNPLVWVHGETVVARCELLRGPIRDVTQDYLHRQPILLRWVLTDDAFRDAEEQLRVSFRQAADVEVRRLPGR